MRQMRPIERIVAVSVKVEMVKPLFGFLKRRAMPFLHMPHDKMMRFHRIKPFGFAVVEFLVDRVPDEMLQLFG